MTTPAENAATVREALEDIAYRSPANNAQGNLNIAREKAVLSLPALAALKAQAETLRADLEQMEANMALVDGVAQAAEADRDRLREKLTAESGYCGEVLSERDQLAARVEELEAEYLEYREANRHGIASLMQERDRLAERVEELKAALGRTATTLETITDRFIPGIDTWEDTDAEESLEIARTALDKDTA